MPQVFKITIHCDKDKFKVEEFKELMSEFSMMKIKGEGVRVGKIDVEMIANEDQPKK